MPRSIEDPLRTHAANATGFLNMLVAARDAGVERFVYAGSSSTYGDHPGLPKVEDGIGRPLSPYAVTKYRRRALRRRLRPLLRHRDHRPALFQRVRSAAGSGGRLRRGDSALDSGMLSGVPVTIYGDGETSRDFCYVANVVQANLLAATASAPEALNQVYNIAVGGRLSLNDLYGQLRDLLTERLEGLGRGAPQTRGFSCRRCPAFASGYRQGAAPPWLRAQPRRARRAAGGVALVHRAPCGIGCRSGGDDS